MKKKTALTLMSVVQVIECNDIEVVNSFLKSSEWVLLNSYINRKYGNKPTYCLGLMEENEDIL